MSDSNFSMQEVRQLCVSFTALLIIHAIFFSAGIFTDEMTNEPPKFNNTGQDIITAGEFPPFPGSPNSGLICPNDCVTHTESQDISDVHYISVLPKSSTGPTDAYEVNFWNTSSNTEHLEVYFDETGENVSFSGDGYEGYVVMEDYDTGTVQWNINERPDGQSQAWYETIPVVGGLLSTGEAIAGVLGWIASTVMWFLQIVVEIMISVVLTIYDFVSFIGSFLLYIMKGWINIANATNDIHYALTLIVFLPQIPLWFILFNGLAKVIKMLPTT